MKIDFLGGTCSLVIVLVIDYVIMESSLVVV